MSGINFDEFLIGREVERLFNQSSVRYGDRCDNPVTGAGYLHGEDPIEPQREAAYAEVMPDYRRCVGRRNDPDKNAQRTLPEPGRRAAALCESFCKDSRPQP